MNLILETTTGQLNNPGLAPSLARGGIAAVFIQFVTANVAALLPGGHPIALKLYSPADTVTPIATLNAFTTSAGDVGYIGQFDTLSGGLANLQRATLLARISYGTPNVDSQLFHVNYGGTGSGPGIPVAPIVITQPAGPVRYVAPLGSFAGKVAPNQIEGMWKAPAACQILGLQLNAQDAPTGAALLVDVIKGGIAQNKIATLAAAAKAQETIFGAPLAVAAGDVIQFQATQVGSTKPGTQLTVGAIVQLV